MKVIINKAERLWKIPQPVLGSMRFSRKRLAARHVDLIDLQSFVPEIPDNLLEPMNRFHAAGATPDPQLSARLAERIISKHFSFQSVALDPEKEIAVTPGIRTTVVLLCLGLLNSGDLAYYPDPGPQYFRTAVCLADGSPRKYSLLESNDYIINISALSSSTNKKTKIIFVNYPHDPTGATVDFYFYRELFRSLRSSNIIVVADCAHIHPGNPDPAGPLQIKNALGKAIELHSFSTTFGLPGLGFAVGHKDAISIIKSLLSAQGFAPSGNALGWAIEAFDRQEESFQHRMETLKNRRELLSDGLKKLDWRIRSGQPTPFIWARPPYRFTSAAIARRLYIKAGVKVDPGSDFGEGGEGWLRLSLSPDEKILTEALRRLGEHSKIWQRKYRPKD
jgi:aspartate/methionine/tyrosine aminotransferase